METIATYQAAEMISPEIIHNLVINGDLAKMTPTQKVEYYNRFCQSLGLNPLTQPFQLIAFQGKLRLYATKDCTEQLRKLHGVSVTEIKNERFDDVFVVTVQVKDREGRIDGATGAVTIGNLKGDNLANALMKAETKAKRRATLSICGLGILDETETETIGTHTVQSIQQVEQIAKQEEAEAKSFNQEPITEATQVFIPLTVNQKTQILLLLNNSVITKEEKARLVEKMSGKDNSWGEVTIAKLKKVIKERTGATPAPAAEVPQPTEQQTDAA